MPFRALRTTSARDRTFESVDMDVKDVLLAFGSFFARSPTREPRTLVITNRAGGGAVMYSQQQLAEYMDEIRKDVCSRCIERPPGGPPCAPLGKRCGIELNLPQLIDAIHAR